LPALRKAEIDSMFLMWGRGNLVPYFLDHRWKRHAFQTGFESSRQ